MTKKKILNITILTIAVILFAFGMCMVLITDWNTLKEGIIMSVVSLVLFFFIMIGNKKIKISLNNIFHYIIGIISLLITGYAMSKTMIINASITNILPYIIIGIAGILICILNYPVYIYLNNKNFKGR